jgi:hypothetical protein
MTKRPGDRFGAFLFVASGRKPPPPVADAHPDPPTDSYFRDPARRATRSALHTQCEYDVAAIHRPAYHGETTGEVRTPPVSSIWTEQEVTQPLSPPGEVAIRHTAGHQSRQSGPSSRPHSTIWAGDQQGGFGGCHHSLKPKLSGLLRLGWSARSQP